MSTRGNLRTQTGVKNRISESLVQAGTRYPEEKGEVDEVRPTNDVGLVGVTQGRNSPRRRAGPWKVEWGRKDRERGDGGEVLWAPGASNDHGTGSP